MARNEGFEYRERLPAAAEGTTVLDWLTRRYVHSSAAEWRARIEAGGVFLDGRVAREDDLLAPGQVLAWRRPPWEEPHAPSDFAVLHRDDDLLAVAKPAGLPTLPGGGYLQNTLLARVRAAYPTASPLHRLGRWTSGILLFALSHRARSDLAAQWRRGTVVKRYRALASGRSQGNSFVVRVPIGPVAHPLLGTVHGASARGKPAETRVTVLERRDDAFLAEVFIATGRPHQIRIHLAAAGHPLVGDPLYGPGGVPLPGTRALPGDAGYHLHAAAVGFRHPSSGRETLWECAPPPTLRTAQEPGRGTTDPAV